MEWRDTGILISTRKQGEASVILEVFTPGNGRHLGVLKGGVSRKMAPHLQPGAQLDLTWKARLEEHMGVFTIEPERSRAGIAMADRVSLAGLNVTLGLLSYCLPEREVYAPLYHRSQALLDLLGRPDLWPLAYLRWELALLEDLGFGLDLDRCAVTGNSDDLIYVSPKSGRAVSRASAGQWADKMLPLPPVLRGQGAAEDSDIAAALATTGYFLENKLAPQLGDRPVPPARGRFIDLLNRRAQGPQ